MPLASTEAAPGTAVPFSSLLFPAPHTSAGLTARDAPEFFTDLNLDQVVRSVTGPKDEYALAPFFRSPVTDLDALHYRQEVFRDLEEAEIHTALRRFAEHHLVATFTAQAKAMREDHGDFSHYHQARHFLNAAESYCAALTDLAADLAAAPVHSRGLAGLRDYLARYTRSTAFRELHAEVRRLEDGLDAVRYSLLVKGDKITVGRYHDEVDYSEQVEATFERFRQGAVGEHLPRFSDWEDYAAAGVLHLVAKVYPDLFSALDQFCQMHADYLDRTVAAADRELQFYLSYLSYIRPLRNAGLKLSYPNMSVEEKAEQAVDTFDIALASQLVGEDRTVVCNEFQLTGPERILVVSGPNNGGKTTLARTFGQLHYLARLGCPVPGRDVHLFLCDAIFTHFERQESLTTLAGKLQEELTRLRADLDRASTRSIFILNEVFNSTTAQDALSLSSKILQQVSDLDALGVCVTFLDELSRLNAKTVSMVSAVVPEDPAIRTYKLVRRPADGRAYARAIAQKYGLTYSQLTSRGVS